MGGVKPFGSKPAATNRIRLGGCSHREVGTVSLEISGQLEAFSVGTSAERSLSLGRLIRQGRRSLSKAGRLRFMWWLAE